MSTPEFDVEQMSKILNMRKNTGGPATVLFLGSKTSSLFRHTFLANLLKEFTSRDMLSMTPIKRFHECYKILEDFKKQHLDHDIHAIIRKALQERQVEVADTYVAELMKQGIFDFIITTNIGRGLEEAFRQSDLMEHRDFEIIIPGTDEFIRNRLEKSYSFKIIKASGDVFSARYSVCGYNIGDREIFLDKYPKLKKSLEEVKDQNIVMVGFDYKWDRHLIHVLFPRRVGSLWYVNEEQTTENSLLFDYFQDCKARRLEGTTGGYERFFEDLCKTLDIVPITLTAQATVHKQEGEEKRRTSDHVPQSSPKTAEHSQPKPSPTSKQDQQRDFFISYNSRDHQWAEWIAWTLEDAGYSVFIQAWDFLSGENFVLDMQKAISQSKRMIAVLSEDYLRAPFSQSEWAAAFVQDPRGERGILLPVQVSECKPTGLWTSIVYIDLVGLSEPKARERLLEDVGGVRQQRKKPDVKPHFPGQTVTDRHLAKEAAMSKTENTSTIDSDIVTDVVIITALSKELDAVLRHLGSYQKIQTKGRTFYKASIQAKNSKNIYQIVVLSLPAMGNYHAALSTQQAISVWNPSYIILTGIAGGVKKETSRYLGDLLIGEQIVSYEPGKQTASGIQRRYEVYRPAKILLDAAKSLPPEEWALSAKVPRPDGTTNRVIPNLHSGVVASGEKVVTDPALINKLQSDWSQLVGIEMEGVGTAIAAYYADNLPGILLVKGMCDWADGSKNDDWQEYAADVAASFVIGLLKSEPFESKGKPQPTRKDRKTLSFSGKVKLSICRRLLQDWKDLADYFDIPAYQRAQFVTGREPQSLWEWLEQREKLPELEDGLKYIGRNDLVELLKELPDN